MRLCYTCQTAPAGNGYGGPVSAYCDRCQPRRPSYPGCAECVAAEPVRLPATVTPDDVSRNPGLAGITRPSKEEASHRFRTRSGSGP